MSCNKLAHKRSQGRAQKNLHSVEYQTLTQIIRTDISASYKPQAVLPMNEAWKNMDLEGEGLQTLSLKLSQQFKQRNRANKLLLLFPFGLHRIYLDDPKGAWLYRSGLLLALSAWLLHRPCIGIITIVIMTGFAVYDIRWIEDRIAYLNKQIRMAEWRNRPATAPKHYRGRYTGVPRLFPGGIL